MAAPREKASSPAAPSRSVAIDLLRGVAVAMVMFAHLPFSSAGLGQAVDATVYPPRWLAELFAHGHFGVQLFLVISGYCIHIRWARRCDLETTVDFLAFWKRRLTRLYPPYLVMLAISVAITLVGSRLFPGSVPPLSTAQLIVDVLVLLLLVQNLTDASARLGNPPFWSLALEEQLYLLYFPLLTIRRRWGWRSALAVPLITTVTWFALGTLVPPSWQEGWYRAGPSYWFAWTLGALAAESHLGVVQLPRFCHSWLTFVLVVALGAALSAHLQALVVTVSFFFLVLATIELEKTGFVERARWLAPGVSLGRISYGVYLVHNVAFVVSKRLLVALGTPAPVTLVLRAAAGIVGGYVLFRLVEDPFLRRAQRIPVPLIPAPRPRSAVSTPPV